MHWTIALYHFFVNWLWQKFLNGKVIVILGKLHLTIIKILTDTFFRDTYLTNNVTDCISLLFQKVEEKHGYLMAAHSIAFVTSAKNGITESEIEDLISLGKLNKIFFNVTNDMNR